MNVGIIGSKGFIGKHLVESLKEDKEVKLFYCDLPDCNLLDATSLRKFIKNKDVIINLAAVSRGTDAEIIAGTVVTTYNLISAIKKCRSRVKIIFLSSIQVETDTVYGISKRLAESMLKDFSQRTKIPVTIFRLTNVFGKGCRPFYNSVVATFCYQVARNQKLTIKNRNKEINFIYVKDLVKLMGKEALTKRKKLFYFKRIVSHNKITISELAKLIKSFKTLKNSKTLKSKFYRNLYKTFLSYSINP